jgi:hypothetical protein
MGCASYESDLVTRAKRLGAFTAADAEMIEALFDPGKLDHAVDLVARAHDPVPRGHRAAVAAAIERELLPHLERYVAKLLESERGKWATEFDAATSFRQTAENIAKLLRLSDPSNMDRAEASEHADALSAIWARFMADVGADRMGVLFASLELHQQRSATANDARAQAADDAALADFTEWQTRAASQLGGLSAPERVKRYKRAKRPLGDRKARRIDKLLREGRLPPLKK